MPLTGRFYGGSPMGGGRTILDFGLCDTKGVYLYTAKLRAKGLLAIVFFSTASVGSVEVLKAVQDWTASVKTDKWTPIAVANASAEELTEFAEKNGLTDITFLLDYEYYQTRNLGISHVPTLLIVSGKTGQVLQRVQGNIAEEIGTAGALLKAEVAKIVAAEEAAKAAAAKAAEEKAAADKKAAEEKAEAAAAEAKGASEPAKV